MGHRRNSPKRDIHSITGLPQETRKISIKQFNCTLKETGIKQQHTKSKVSRRKDIVKIRAEINEIESKIYKTSMKARDVSLKNKLGWQIFKHTYQVWEDPNKWN